jgi:hypothetical protein
LSRGKKYTRKDGIRKESVRDKLQIPSIKDHLYRTRKTINSGKK